MRRELLLLREMRDAAAVIRDLVGDRSAEDVEARDDLLSFGERKAEGRTSWLESPNNGKAMERAAARDKWVQEHFDHLGGAGRPDFVSRATGTPYEVTTSNPSTMQNAPAAYICEC